MFHLQFYFPWSFNFVLDAYNWWKTVLFIHRLFVFSSTSRKTEELQQLSSSWAMYDFNTSYSVYCLLMNMLACRGCHMCNYYVSMWTASLKVNKLMNKGVSDKKNPKATLVCLWGEPFCLSCNCLLLSFNMRFCMLPVSVFPEIIFWVLWTKTCIYLSKNKGNLNLVCATFFMTCNVVKLVPLLAIPHRYFYSSQSYSSPFLTPMPLLV